MEDIKYNLRNILDAIEEAAECDNREMLIKVIESIPEVVWKDGSYSKSIMETFLEWVDPHFELYPIDFIPDYFWKYEDNVSRYIGTICCYYDADTYKI